VVDPGAAGAGGGGVIVALWLGCAPPPEGPATWVAHEADALDGWALRDADGAPVTPADAVGQWTAVLLGYTSCPDVCQGSLGGVRAALDALEAEGLPVALWFVAVDPARDEAQLGPWSSHFGARAMTGDEGALHQLALQLGGSFALRDDGTVDHSTALTLIDPQGRPVGWQARPSDAAMVAADVGAVMRSWAPAVRVEEGWARAPIGPRGMAAGYGRLVNEGDEALRLVGASSPDTAGVYVHETVQVDGVASMRPTTLAVDAGGSAVLAPGGAHLMLPQTDGGRASVRVRLDLEGAPDLWVALPLRP